MSQISFDLYTNIEYQRRHKELMDEVERARLARDAKKMETGKNLSSNKFLALLGRGLTSFGENLVERYHIENEQRPG
jgi:hypothetical protein